jgi:hypothetical protein
MKYLYFIAVIILASSLALAFQWLPFFGANESAEEIALVVNDRAITSQEMAAAESLQPSREGAESTVDSVITRELLIQEAKRRGIDREDDFRTSIKDFYEQTLVKILLDRQEQVLHNKVSDEYVARYIQLLGTTVELTISRLPGTDSPEKSTEKKQTSKFADLSDDLRCRLAALKEGERTEPIPRGELSVVYRLDRIEPDPEVVAWPKELARRLLEDFQKRQSMNLWLNELRQKATIKVLGAVHK